MNKQEFESVVDKTMATLSDLRDTKGADYTQGDQDVLLNFKRNGQRLGMDPQKVLMVYLNKHMDAIETYVRHGSVTSEPIDGRIDDAINYLLLLKGLIGELEGFHRGMTLDDGESVVPASRFRGASRVGGPVDPS